MAVETNPYLTLSNASPITRGESRIAHRVLLAVFIVALIAFWDPPPQPRYDGSWYPPTVALVGFVFYGWAGTAICFTLGLASFAASCCDVSLRRDSRRWLWVRLNLITWFCLYAAIPLWNRFVRQPEW